MASLQTPSAFTSQSYDYLITGGGTAGLVLANRFSEIPSVNVGVIQAGEDLTNDTIVLLLLYMFDMQGDLKYDWNFSNLPPLCPSSMAEALDGAEVRQARGKMLGGSSGINYMQFTFASRTGLERLGNEGWSYDSLVTYYRKFGKFQGAPAEVDNIGIDDFIEPSMHGSGGPINASFSPF